jgi:abortive infection protein abiGII
MIFNSVKHLKDTIRNRENKFNLPPNTLINYYMMERFLCRINKSKYSYNFVIKGGFLLSSIIGIDMRSTMDIDATVKGIPVNSYTITNIIDEIIKVDLEDNIKFEIEKISTIHEEGYYENFRVTLIANFFNMKVPIKVDITTGDVIIPNEIDYNYSLLFTDKTLSIKAYPILTILAEKIESIIVRNITSTRARDYYDVYILLKQNPDIDIDELKNATYKKAEERKTKDYLENTLKYFDYIKSSKELEELWKNFCKKKSYAKDISWEEIIGSLDNLFKTMNRSY